jgi:hypothetical protein
VSSLPPYNPLRTSRLVWLVHPGGADATLHACAEGMGGLAASWVEAEDARERLSRIVTSDAWHLIATGADAAGNDAAGVAVAIRNSQGSTLLVAGPPLLEAVLRDLLELPAGSARLRFIPGSATTVQVLPDRAVLRHLNQGAAIE